PSPRMDRPAGSRPGAERPRQTQDAVIASAPVLQASPHLGLGGSRLETHEGEREGIEDLVVLRREVVRLRLAAAADQRRLFLTLVHVVRNRAEVVEELA